VVLCISEDKIAFCLWYIYFTPLSFLTLLISHQECRPGCKKLLQQGYHLMTSSQST